MVLRMVMAMVCFSSWMMAQNAHRVEQSFQELYPLISLDELQIVRPWLAKSCATAQEAFSPLIGKLPTLECSGEHTIYPPCPGERCPVVGSTFFYPVPTWRRNLFETWQAPTVQSAQKQLIHSLKNQRFQLSQICLEKGGEIYWHREKWQPCQKAGEQWRCRGRLWSLCEVRDY